MSYYGYNHRSNNSIGLGGAILCLALAGFLMLMINCFAEPKWNQGICPECEVRYELRGASRGLKYYSCPECGQEVERY